MIEMTDSVRQALDSKWGSPRDSKQELPRNVPSDWRMHGSRLLPLCIQNPRKPLAIEGMLLYFHFAMQENDENSDDVASSDRARQRAQKVQKPHGKKKKE